MPEKRAQTLCILAYVSHVSPYVHVFLCREFIDKHVVDFAKNSPQIVVNVQVRGNAHPYIKSEYRMSACRLSPIGPLLPVCVHNM